MASRYACGPVKALPFGECVRLYVRVPAPKVNPSPPSAPRRVAPPAGEPPAPLPDDMPLPDFCNFGVVLRVLAVVNAVAVLGALAGAQTLIDAAQRFVSAAPSFEISALLSLALLCLLRVRLAQERGWIRTAGVVVVVACVAATVEWLITFLPGLQTPYGVRALAPLSSALVAAALAWAVLEFYHLRVRAYSPAIAAARLQALQSRIRPHFLFNSLNAAIALVRTDPLRAELVLEDLSDLFRMIMKDARTLITLEEEITLARQYLAIEGLRLGDRLHVEWQLLRLPPQFKVPPLLLQPLLENAIRHGIEPNDEPGTIAVRITGVARELIIVVENSYEPREVVPGNRIALQNIRERLAVLYDLEASVKATGDGKRYRVSITLPVEAQSAG